MTTNKETAEQRQKKRFRVEDGAFVVLNPADPKVGRLIDISTVGLAFTYVGGEKPLKKSTEVNIFSEGCSFCLYRLPCDIILDLGPNVNDFAPLNIRECRVKFGKLKQDQMSELKRFIRNHTLN